MKQPVKKSIILFLSIMLFAVMSKTTIYLADALVKGSFLYTWLFVDHAIQLVLTLLIMVLPIWSKSLSDWGINAKNKDNTFKILGKFAVGWIVCTTIFVLCSSLKNGWGDILSFPLSLKNVTIYLLFEGTIVGAAEEIFFRGLIYGILIKHFGKKIKLIGFSVSAAGIITALIFAFAHVGFIICPFAITYFNTMQFIMAFLLGIFYAVILERTDSLLGPILAHNISDLWLSVLYVVIQLFTKGV